MNIKILGILVICMLLLTSITVVGLSVEKNDIVYVEDFIFPYPEEGCQPPPPGDLRDDAPSFDVFYERLYLRDNTETTSVTGDIENWILEIDEAMVQDYIQDLVDFGPRVSGSTACYNAGDYIYNEFDSMGLDVRYQFWDTGSLDGTNIEATLYGGDPSSDEIYVVCGHYDSVSGSPGADDNAAGTAAALAAANVLSQHSVDHTVRFVAFSGEEQGLIGSDYYVEEAYNNGDNLVATLNADMIGYAETPDDASKIKLYTNGDSQWIVDYTTNVASAYDSVIGLNVINAGYASNSDHYRFWQFGYDAVMYHEYHFNPYYHSSQDTISNMDMDYDMRVSRLIMATLAELAEPVVLAANFSYSPEYPNPVDTIFFTDESAGDIISWSWNFGDGGSSNQQNPTHVYSSENEYEVTLTIYDGEKTASISKTIGVWDNWPPLAIAQPDFYAGNNPTVNFDGSGSWDPDGTIVGYLWDFNDGSTSTQMNPTHTYSQDGIYYVTLTVTDDGGKTGTAYCEIRIDAYTPPETTVEIIGSYGNNNWIKASALIELEAFDWTGVDYTKYKLNNDQSWHTYDVPVRVWSNGYHTVYFYSVDVYGNTEDEKSADFKIDAEKPTLNIDIEGEKINDFYVSDVTVTCSATDQVSGLLGIWYQLAGETGWIEYTDKITVSGDGRHILRVYAEDNAGNREYTPGMEPIIIDIDNQPPVTNCILDGYQPEGTWYQGDVTVTLTAEDTAGVDYTEYKIDDGSWQTYTNPFIVSERGKRTITFYSTDILGQEEEQKTKSFQIGVPPDTPSITGPPSGSPNVEYTFTISGTHPEGSPLEYYIEWGDDTIEDWFGPYASGEETTASHTYTSQQTFTIKVKARDQWDGESDWGTMQFSTPKNKITFKFLIKELFDNLLNKFPVLERIMIVLMGGYCEG